MKKIRTAVIGTGYLGRFHAQKYATLPESDLVGVVDCDLSRAKAIADEHSTSAFASHAEVIDLVDAVSIVTPTETHFAIAMDFLSRGKDVLIEKPMTGSPVDAQALINEAERTGAVLQVGHLERFNAAVVALEGKYSTPVFIETHRLSPFPNRNADVDVVLDVMIHDIDIILNLVRSEVVSVEASGVPIITDKVDIANARLTFENGCVACVTASRAALEPQRTIKLFERDAYISIDYARQHISINRRSTDAASGEMTMVGEELDIVRKDTLLEEIKSFLVSCRDRTPAAVSGYDGKRALEVAQRIQSSVAESMAVFDKQRLSD